METKHVVNDVFQLRPLTKDPALVPGRFQIGRSLIGRSESCEFVIPKSFVSAVHAVLEVSPRGVKIYDMNSRNGTMVNGQKVVAKELRPGDKVTIGNLEYVFEDYAPINEFPPVLESLEPQKGSASVLKGPIAPPPPVRPEQIEEDNVPYIVYPLSKDPKADYSEYIFEDAEVLYPIFKYDHNKAAVEVIILHKDRVFSVDYLPEKNGTYKIVGSNPKKNTVEFPYLGSKEEVPFIEMRNGHCTVRNLHSYQMLHLSDKDITPANNEVQLTGNDIVKLTNGNLEIYVRLVVAPPKVKPAPFFDRDKQLRRYVLLVLLIVFAFSFAVNMVEKEPEEAKKETDPERLARILYKQPPVVSQNRAVEKTKEAPKVEQKVKNEVTEKKVEPPKKEVVEKKPEPVQKPVPKPDTTGTPKAETVQQVKKVERPAPKTPVPSAKPATTASAAPARANTQATTNLKSLGTVDTFKSDFASSVNTLMAKGGSLSSANTRTATGADGIGSTANIGGGVASNVQTANARAEIGSLTGAAVGKLAESKGVEGIGSAKKGIFTAGIPSDTVVLGSMDPDTIRRILKEHQPQFRYCYQQELDKNPGKKLAAIVRMNFQIGATGHVTRAEVVSENMPTPVKSCVASVLRGIAFPAPLGGGVVDVSQPLNFYPVSGR